MHLFVTRLAAALLVASAPAACGNRRSSLTPSDGPSEARAGVEGPRDAAPPDAAPPDGAPPDAPADPAPALHAARLTGEPTVAAWAPAVPLRFATDWQGRPVPPVTTVRALWSPEALHLRWDLEGTDLHTDHTRPVDVEREGLYQEDCVEMFLAPDPALPTRYAEIEVGPFGHRFDLLIDRVARTSDLAWDAGLTITTRQDPAARTATIEYRVTTPYLTAALRPGASLPLGLYRMEGAKPRLYLAAFPTHTPKPSFHVPSAFGRLVLDP